MALSLDDTAELPPLPVLEEEQSADVRLLLRRARELPLNEVRVLLQLAGVFQGRECPIQTSAHHRGCCLNIEGDDSPALPIPVSSFAQQLRKRGTGAHAGEKTLDDDTEVVGTKMLAEFPGDRFPNVPELCRALQDALTKADGDPAWDVALVDPHDPQVGTTNEDPARVEPNEALRAYRKQGKRRPRRGLIRPDDARDLLMVPSPVAEPDDDRIPTVDVPGSATPPAAPELPASVSPVQAAPGGLELPAPVVRALPAWTRLGLVAALLTAAVGVLYLSVDAWGPGTSSPSSLGRPRPTLPSTYPGLPATLEAAPGREMASSWEPPDSIFQVGAAPFGAQPPASPIYAMPSMLSQTPKTEAPKSQIQRAAFRLGLKPLKVAAAVAACTGPGCTGNMSQVRTGSPLVTCPVGWEKTHEKFDTGAGTIVFQGYQGQNEERVPVKDGPAIVLADDVGNLPRNALLIGTWTIQDERIFGTFTEARIPGAGSVPVCMVVGTDVITGMPDGAPDCLPGEGACLAPGGKYGHAKSFSRLHVYPPFRKFR